MTYEWTVDITINMDYILLKKSRRVILEEYFAILADAESHRIESSNAAIKIQNQFRAHCIRGDIHLLF